MAQVGHDPRRVPIRDAATVLILDERPDLHVLMLERSPRSAFVPGAWVFPGGAVDPDDATAEADALVAGLSDAEASAQLGVARGGIAFWVAALRETFEEAGVLLARRPGEHHRVALSDPVVADRYERWRAGVNAGTVDFVAVMEREGLSLDGTDVHYVGRWITPVGSRRRHDTRFFVTAMPSDQVPLHDDAEAVHHEWVRPAEAIVAHERGAMELVTPTLAMLVRLTRFADVASALASAIGATPDDDERIRVRRGMEGSAYVVAPGEAHYDGADPLADVGVIRWPL